MHVRHSVVKCFFVKLCLVLFAGEQGSGEFQSVCQNDPHQASSKIPTFERKIRLQHPKRLTFAVGLFFIDVAVMHFLTFLYCKVIVVAMPVFRFRLTPMRLCEIRLKQKLRAFRIYPEYSFYATLILRRPNFKRQHLSFMICTWKLRQCCDFTQWIGLLGSTRDSPVRAAATGNMRRVVPYPQ